MTQDGNDSEQIAQPHGNQLVAAMQKEETPEVLAARAHIARCPDCQAQLAHVLETFANAGLFEAAPDKRPPLEIAQSLRQSARKLSEQN